MLILRSTLYRSIHKDARVFSRYFLNYHTPLPSISACVCVRVYHHLAALASHQRGTRVAPIAVAVFALTKKGPLASRRATLTLFRNATRGSRRQRKRRESRRWKGRWRTRVATEARPGVHPLALPRPAAGVPPSHHDDRDVHTRR